MRELPVLFSGPMVRAILDGRKTQTRRILKPQPSEDVDRLIGPELYEPMAYDAFGGCYPGNEIYGVYDDFPGGNYGVKCPWRPGDKLWVRETWTSACPYPINQCPPGKPKQISFVCDVCEHNKPYYFRADMGEIMMESNKWKLSIFMPRAASRIMLEVTDVRVEQLQDITEEGAIAEGCSGVPCDHPLGRWACEDCYNSGWLEPPQVEFMQLWDSINAKKGYGWDANPWVWVIVFRRVERD
jgi:hypothetical protein